MPGHAAIASQPSGQNQPERFESQLDTKRKLFCNSSQPENALRASQREPLEMQVDKLALHKHAIRQSFHKQMRQLWSENAFLRSYKIHPNDVRGGSQIDTRPIHSAAACFGHIEEEIKLSEYIARNFQENGYCFVPLVCEDFSLQCSLDILFLRRDIPGSAIQAGDIDNRVKTLIDSLRKPKGANELRGNETPQTGEDPFFCLLEDDKLISKFSVETDTLLDEISSGEADKRKANVIVTVELKPYYPTYLNLAFS
jgi:hypothetical protein